MGKVGIVGIVIGIWVIGTGVGIVGDGGEGNGRGNGKLVGTGVGGKGVVGGIGEIPVTGAGTGIVTVTGAGADGGAAGVAGIGSDIDPGSRPTGRDGNIVAVSPGAVSGTDKEGGAAMRVAAGVVATGAANNAVNGDMVVMIAFTCLKTGL